MARFVKLLMVIVATLVVAFAAAGDNETSGPAKIRLPESVTTPTLEADLLHDSTQTPQKQKLWTLKEFGSNQCIPCRQMKPVLKKIASEYEGVVEVQVLEIKEYLAEAQKYRVMLIPTQILLDPQGDVQWQHVGFIPKESLELVLHEKGIKKPDKPR